MNESGGAASERRIGILTTDTGRRKSWDAALER